MNLGNCNFYPLKLLLPIMRARVTLRALMRPSGWYDFETQIKCFLFVFNHIVYYRHRSQKIAMFIVSCSIRKMKALRQYIEYYVMSTVVRWKRTNSNCFEINVLSTPNVGGGAKFTTAPGGKKSRYATDQKHALYVSNL